MENLVGLSKKKPKYSTCTFEIGGGVVLRIKWHFPYKCLNGALALLKLEGVCVENWVGFSKKVPKCSTCTFENGGGGCVENWVRLSKKVPKCSTCTFEIGGGLCWEFPRKSSNAAFWNLKENQNVARRKPRKTTEFEESFTFNART